MNNVSLIGRLTRDPEVRYSQGEKSTVVTKFTIAVNRMKKDEADFINCTAFGKTAEVIEKYFKKGNQIGIDGRIQTGSYKDRDDRTVYTTEVIVLNVTFIDKKDKLEEPVNNYGQADSDGFMSIPDGIDEELPFN